MKLHELNENIGRFKISTEGSVHTVSGINFGSSIESFMTAIYDSLKVSEIQEELNLNYKVLS